MRRDPSAPEHDPTMLRTTALHRRLLRPDWLRAAALALLFVAATLAGQQPARAQRSRLNNVERLREALDADKTSGLERLKSDDPLLKYRKDNLTKRAKALVSLGEMTAALLLSNWRLTEPEAVGDIDLAVYNELAGRFQQMVRNVMKTGRPEERAAIASLIGDMAVTERNAGYPMLTLRTKLVELAPAIIELTAPGEAPDVQAAAALALANLQANPDDTVKALAAMLHSRSPKVQLAAAEALASFIQIASQRTKKSTVRLAAGEGDLTKYLLDAAALSIPPACQALRADQPAELRRAGAEVLKQSGAILRDLVQDRSRQAIDAPPTDRKWTEADVQRAADIRIRDLAIPETLVTMSRLDKGFENQDAVLNAALTATDPKLRVLTLQALEELADALRKLRTAEDRVPTPPDEPPAPHKDLPFERLLRSTLPSVTRALTDPNVEARRSALNVLEWIGQDARAALPDLLRALQDRDLFVRWAAVRTLGVLVATAPEKSPVSEGEMARIVQGMVRLLADQDLNLRLAVLTAFEEIGPRAAAAVPVLWATVNSSDPDYRINVLRALQSIGPAAIEGPGGAVLTPTGVSLPAFARVLADPDVNVRKAALEAFARFAAAVKPEERGEKLRRLLTDPNSDVRIALNRLLSDPDPEVRKARTDALLQLTKSPE
jgi:HEAT repeat protein